VTQQNAAMVEQSTAATHSLANETDALNRALTRFQLGNTPSKSAPRSAPRLATLSGNTAVKADPENWDSF
jgi:methyl-accepting chemotaxis protein